MMWTLIGITFAAAMMHSPTRRRLDDAVHVLFTGKTLGQEKEDADRENAAIDVRMAAGLADLDISEEVVQRVASDIAEKKASRSEN